MKKKMIKQLCITKDNGQKKKAPKMQRVNVLMVVYFSHQNLVHSFTIKVLKKKKTKKKLYDDSRKSVRVGSRKDK